MTKLVKLKWDANILVTATVNLDGQPLVELSHPDVFLDNGRAGLRPCEARTLARALIVAADVADAKRKQR